ncbi:MAG: hypothetical protein EXS09_20100 [Gemmataceae bacterium]|nr:hypothetical protein [Gemmataceae bacterium]
MIGKDLGLRTDQLDDVKSIRGMRVEEIAKLVTAGERFDKVKPKVDATNGDSFDRMAEMLTRTQVEKLKELKGKAFVDIAAQKVNPGAALDVIPKAPYPTELFGLYDFEVR